MKARVKATGEVWEFSQIDEITFKSAINGHLYCAEELEFIEPSIFTPDYWERLKHQYAGMAMQAMLTSPELLQVVTRAENLLTKGYAEKVAIVADKYAHALVERMKQNNNNQ